MLEVLPFCNIHRHRFIKILYPKDTEVYTPLALKNGQKGGASRHRKVHENRSLGPIQNGSPSPVDVSELKSKLNPGIFEVEIELTYVIGNHFQKRIELNDNPRPCSTSQFRVKTDNSTHEWISTHQTDTIAIPFGFI